VHWDRRLGKTIMTVAVPLKTANGRFLGALAAMINCGSMEAVLRQWAQGQTRHLYILKPDGTRVLRSLLVPEPVLTTRLPEDATRALFTGEAGDLHRLTDEDIEVLAVLQPVPRLGWGVVAEKTTRTPTARWSRSAMSRWPPPPGCC
jgi:hypothetical protein